MIQGHNTFVLLNVMRYHRRMKRKRNTRFPNQNALCYVVTPGKRGPCKLGVTYTLQERINTLQCGNWVELRAHAALWFATMKEAQAVERAAMQLLTRRDAWLRGEWFNVVPDVAHLALVESATTLGIEILNAPNGIDHVLGIMAGMRNAP